MASIEELFPRFIEVVTSATEATWTLSDAGEPDLLGGRRARLARKGEELHIAWDGREHWLTLSYVPRREYPPAFVWTGLLSERYDGANISEADRDRLERALAEHAARLGKPRYA